MTARNTSAGVRFEPGQLTSDCDVTVQYEGASPELRAEDTRFEVQGEIFHHGDVLSINVQQHEDGSPTQSNVHDASDEWGLATLPCRHPEADDALHPFLFRSEGQDPRQASNFQLMSSSVVKYVDGALQFLVEKGSAVYELVWASSQALVDQIGDDIGQLLSRDRERLHIRVHYRCHEETGYPDRLQTFIAAGPPPRPTAANETLDDGLFTAEHIVGTDYLQDMYVSRRSKVKVRIDLTSTSTRTTMKPLKYVFDKTQQNGPFYKYSPRLNSHDGSERMEEWEIVLEAKEGSSKRNVGEGGNTILAVKQQVSAIKSFQACDLFLRASNAVVFAGNPGKSQHFARS